MKNLRKIDRHNTTFTYIYPKRPLKISPSQILNRYIPISLAVIGILALFIWLGQRNKDQHDWQLSYEPQSREPYGTAVTHDILRGYLPTQKLEDLKDRTAKSLPTDGVATSANYVFIGDGFLPDTVDTDKLLLFVHNGGRAFIAANAVPNYLLERVAVTICDTVDNDYDEDNFYHAFQYDYADSANLNFNHPQLIENKAFKYHHFYKNTTTSTSWSYLDTLDAEESTCTEGGDKLAPIGTMNDKMVNFARINYGKGAVFIHTTPLAFANITLLDSTKLPYMSKAFSHLQDGIIYWDNKSRTSSDVVQRMNGSNPKIDRDSPLKFILAQPSLRWAWFLMLGLVVIYFVLGAKRRQRIIPIMEEKTNTSLQFIQTISLMYFRGQEHVRICDMKIKQFQTFVRERYHLNTRVMDDEFIQTLAMKSNIVDADIRKITLFEKRLAYNDITEDAMIELHRLLTKFYRNCK